MKSIFSQFSRKRRKSGTQPSRSNSISSRFSSARNTLSPGKKSGVESIIENPDPNPDEPQPRLQFHQSFPQATQDQKLRDQQRNIRLSRKIASMSNMLRDMYSLELRIFGTKNGRWEDEEQRIQMMAEVDAMFNVVILTLDEWYDEGKRYTWTDAEWEMIRKIREVANCHAPRRHRHAGSAEQQGVLNGV